MYVTNPVRYTNPDNASKARLLSRALGGMVIAIGCLVLMGWEFDITIFKSVLPGLATMKSMTAILFILSGASLSLQVMEQNRRLAQICAAIVTLVGLLTLGEYIFNGNFGIDQLLFKDTGTGMLYPGRMVPAAALSFFLIGIALIVLDNPKITHQEIPILITFAISMLALTGYLYGASELYRIGEYSSMALHTAVSFLLLSLGILFARPERGMLQIILADTAGGHVLRRFLPAVIILPTILGWIRLMGQRAGLYDTSFGLAIMVISLITSLYILIWVNARQLTDIDHKRKQADDLSRAADLRFHSTLQTMTEGCQIIGHDWRYLYLNDSAVRHSGLPWEKMIGRTVMECFPDIEESAMFPALRRALQGRVPATLVNSMLLPNGSKRWFEWRIEPSPDGIFILSNDITDRRQAEQALLEREMQLSKLFEILPVGISILDAKRQVTYSNPALKKILHISAQDLRTGTYANRTYRKTDGTHMDLEELASHRAFREHRQIDNLETGIVIEDGTTVWTSVSAVPVALGEWQLVLVTVDITERKLAEVALRESEQKYSLLFDKSAVPAAVLKLPEVVIVDVNEALVKLVGYSRQEMLGKTVADLGIASPTARTQAINKFEEQGSLSNNERLLTTKTGEQRIIVGNTNALSLHGVRYAVSTMQDITERKRAEDEIIKINAELEEKVVQRTSELAAANERLHQLSILDELTGLYNRRGFLLLAEEQILLAKRTKSNLIVFYADLDGLKQINDERGHHAGDEAIRTAAKTICETFRASDIKARLGGDEFIVLAIQAGKPNVPTLLTRLHTRLGNHNLSMSVGIVTIDPQNEMNLADLINRADNAMYKIKLQKPGHRQTKRH